VGDDNEDEPRRMADVDSNEDELMSRWEEHSVRAADCGENRELR
jgi:hypothetical protein